MRAALAFLTIVPATGRREPPPRAALIAFPAVGALIGLAWRAAPALDCLSLTFGVWYALAAAGAAWYLF